MKVRLAWAEVRARLGQLSAAVIMIALGVALAAGTIMANQALRKSFHEALEALSGQADLQVVAAAGGAFPASVLDEVRSVDGVEAAAALVSGIAHLDERLGAGVIRILGVDLLDDASVRIFESENGTAAIDEPLIFLNQPDSIAVPRAFADAHGIREGSPLVIETASGTQSLTVRGILEDLGAGRSFGGNFGVMDLYAAQELLDLKELASQIDLIAPDPARARAELRRVLPEHLSIASVEERNQDRARTLAAFQVIQDLVSVLGLLLAALIASNRLATVYQARLWEIGVMRALGRSPRQITRRLLLEATLLSAIGVAIGLPVGWLMAQWIVDPLAESMFLNFKEIVARPTVSPSLSAMALAALAGVGSGVLAAWFPARRAAALPVVDILAQGRRRDPWPTSAAKRWARIALPLLAVALVALQMIFGIRLFAGLLPIIAVIAGGLSLQPGMRSLAAPLARALGLKRSIGLKDQGRFPSRATGAAGILMVGVAMVLWIASMRDSFEEYVVASLMASRDGDLIVESSFDIGADKPRLSQGVVDVIAAIPGVSAVGTEITAKTRASGSDLEVGVLVSDGARLRNQEFGTWAIQEGGRGALERVADSQGVLVNPQFLDNHDKKLGETVEILSPSGSFELPIVGITTTSFLSPTGDVVISRNLYRDHWHDAAVIRAFVLIDEDHDARVIKSRILGSLSDTHQIKVISTEDLGEFMGQNVREGFAFMDALALLTLFVVVVGTSDALAADIVERMREIGTLRALGFSPRDVSTMLAAQALAIGIVGSSVGLLVGVAMTVAYLDAIIPQFLGWQIRLQFAPEVALSCLAAGIFACLLGAAIPALRGARLSPVDALRYE